MATTERNRDDVDAGAQLGIELSDAVVLFHEALASLTGLTAADNKALGIVRRDGPLSAGELAARTGLTAGAVTGLVDRLERAGLARRTRHPQDRRKLVIEASAGTNPAVQQAIGRLTDRMADVTGHFTEEQLAVIVDWITRTSAVLRDGAAEISRDRPADRSR